MVEADLAAIGLDGAGKPLVKTDRKHKSRSGEIAAMITKI